jgi:hypothetical protein
MRDYASVIIVFLIALLLLAIGMQGIAGRVLAVIADPDNLVVLSDAEVAASSSNIT